MAKFTIRRHTAATIFTSKHYFKKKKKCITFTPNLIQQLYSHPLLSNNAHQSTFLNINQLQIQPIQHETTSNYKSNTSPPNPTKVMPASFSTTKFLLFAGQATTHFDDNQSC